VIVTVRVLPFLVAVMNFTCVLAVADVVALNVCEVFPYTNVTDAGTDNGAPLEVKFTTNPLPGVPFAKIVHETGLPPLTVVGVAVIEVMSGSKTFKFRVMETPFNVAVTLRVIGTDVTVVPTLKVAVVAPFGTVTLAGVIKAALLSESVTTLPAVGAKVLSVTVPVALFPEITPLGLNVKFVRM
jgi:hypothetical protein